MFSLNLEVYCILDNAVNVALNTICVCVCVCAGLGVHVKTPAVQIAPSVVIRHTPCIQNEHIDNEYQYASE